MSNKKEEIHDLLKKRMKELNIKSVEISKKTGVSKHMVSKAINGHLVKSDSGSMLKICNFLGVNLNQLQVTTFESSRELSPEKCQVIMNAVRDVWDGTQESAVAIAQLLQSARWISRTGDN
jgi:transcriptional regulator with XRE-family HTH domain